MRSPRKRRSVDANRYNRLLRDVRTGAPTPRARLHSAELRGRRLHQMAAFKAINDVNRSARCLYSERAGRTINTETNWLKHICRGLFARARARLARGRPALIGIAYAARIICLFAAAGRDATHVRQL
ncbi:hypothetical protein EVAR_51842_1 [Eumeta japonica]|uniref:Uncharacterized protein n=1 Tax=Eumeta variegata TaxID=151549 RepID=A0A4C1YNS3_EUMVA|nr:hypothetical protein EVAR_51842_1 [Eumeta japonica]